MKQVNRDTTRVCICPQCGELFAVKIKAKQATSINFKEQACTKCLRGLTVAMDRPSKKAYA